MSEINTPAGTSTSKGVNDIAKKSWEGGVSHGSTDGGSVLGASPTKHPLPTSFDGGTGPSGKAAATNGKNTAVQGKQGPAGTPVGNKANMSQAQGPAGSPVGRGGSQQGKVSWWPGKQ